MNAASPLSGTSFGARGRPAAGDPCPCGLAAFGSCCGPILAGESAPTATTLMRSRYTAFALGDRRHLEATWHPSTRPDHLDLDAGLTWTRLTIIDAHAGQPGDTAGTVEFRAQWRETATGDSGVLHERSRFAFQRGRWWYVDGDLDPPSR